MVTANILMMPKIAIDSSKSNLTERKKCRAERRVVVKSDRNVILGNSAT
jgi:hypothetical protein